MQLYIAEKPDLAKAIVDALGGGTTQRGFTKCSNDIVVTWCVGHMLELCTPEDYNPAYAKWDLAALPFKFIPWRKKRVERTADQYAVIESLVSKADTIVHAGDPDEEGQLIVDEILNDLRFTGSVKRVLINDNNLELVRRAIANMQPNENFVGLSASADARGAGDLLYGINVTRAYTLIAQAAGCQDTLHVGRVQTPILGMVVRRYLENKGHQAVNYLTVAGQFKFGDAEILARYRIVQNDPVDDKGRLNNETQASGIAAQATGKPASIDEAKTIHKKTAAPLPYNLLKLQIDASRKFKFMADKTLSVTQGLRDRHKLITYNRSDCEYLSDEQHADAPAVLAAIAQTATMLKGYVDKADSRLKSRAFNSKKISAHHAIIPTAKITDFSTLTPDEQRIYLLIARAYVAQFWPVYEYDQTDLTISCATHIFECKSNTPTHAGWKPLYVNDKDNEDIQDDPDALMLDLRQLNVGQKGQCTEAKATKRATKPAPLYTVATLLGDLTRVAKYVKDDRLRKLLIEKDKDKAGEHGGIGTPATRDSIIKGLFEHEYFTMDSDSVIPTSKAITFYSVLPDQAKYPDMTALWHEQQKGIVAGERTPEDFVTELMQYVGDEITRVKRDGLGIKFEFFPCPKCKKPLRRLKGEKGYFWACTDREACGHNMNDKDGKPVARAYVSEIHKCMNCGKGLARREGKKQGGKTASPWWSCSGYPECCQTYEDAKGRPNYAKGKKS